jgi:hypothetical protein
MTDPEIGGEVKWNALRIQFGPRLGSRLGHRIAGLYFHLGIPSLASSPSGGVGRRRTWSAPRSGGRRRTTSVLPNGVDRSSLPAGPRPRMDPPQRAPSTQRDGNSHDASPLTAPKLSKKDAVVALAPITQAPRNKLIPGTKMRRINRSALACADYSGAQT